MFVQSRIGAKRIITTLTETMQKKGISVLYFIHIRASENELALKGYVSTLWGYDKADFQFFLHLIYINFLHVN